jgi:hypothetical protein
MRELADISEIASADVHFRRQNSNQRQARPLPEAKTREQLLPRVVKRRLYAINSGDGQ